MFMDWPLIQWAWSEQRKTMVPATSFPVPGRPMGMLVSRRSESSRLVGGVVALSQRDVSMTPRQTVLTACIFGLEYNGTWGISLRSR